MIVFDHVIVVVGCVLCLGLVCADTRAYPTVTATLEAYTGTCKAATVGFDIAVYYNLDAIQQTSSTSFPPPATDISGSSWDLGRDGAFVGFTIMYCEIQDFPGYTPTAVLDLVRQKGVVVEETCDFARLVTRHATTGLLTYSVLVLADLGLLSALTAEDVNAVVTYYTTGGALFLLAHACPSVQNVNQILGGLPAPVNGIILGNANAIYPSIAMSPGDPRTVNQFGFHVSFTGVSAMTTGQSSAVPYSRATSAVSGGIYAPLATQPLTPSSLSACNGDPAVSASPTTYPAAMYVDPLVQLASIPAARQYGRLVVDTAISRYRGQDDARTGSRRFGANLIIWLLDVESKWLNTSGNGTAVDTSQLVACSSGDSFRIKSIGAACSIDFYPTDVGTPHCISKIVTVDQGTTCQMGINALYGAYWILMDGKNTVHF
jgi:hypothetical protein